MQCLTPHITQRNQHIDERDEGDRRKCIVGHVAQQGRLTGGSLAAAGGWCSPSETLYDLAPLLADANAGLVDVPDIGVRTPMTAFISVDLPEPFAPTTAVNDPRATTPFR